MSNFVAIYTRRSRQIVVVAIMGAFGLVATVMLSQALPRYMGLTATTDGRAVHLTAQAFPPTPDGPMFLTAHSSDGVAFGAPSVRDGFVEGIAAQGGRLHALFGDGSLLSLSGKPDDWRTLRPQLAWRPTGIATVDNELVAFGQSADKPGTILGAALDNATWRPWGEFAAASDNIGHFLGVHSRGEDYVVWVELVTPAESGGKRLPPEEAAMLPVRVGVARASAGKFEPAAKFEPGRPIAYTVAGDDAGVRLFYKVITSVSKWSGYRLDPTVRETTFVDGAWTAPRVVPTGDTWWQRSDDLAAASIGGRTYLYTCDYLLGVLYAGAWGTELRGESRSEKFLVMGPTERDMTNMIRWAALATGAAFIAGGAIAAFILSKRRGPETRGKALYAAVTDRSTAAMLDLALVYSVLNFLIGEADPLQFWMTLVVGYLIYGAVFEGTSAGQTPAKRLLGLRVLDAASGQPIGFEAAVRRNLFKFFEMITVGAGVALSAKRFQRPGDFFAGTVVVKEFPEPRSSE